MAFEIANGYKLKNGNTGLLDYSAEVCFSLLDVEFERGGYDGVNGSKLITDTGNPGPRARVVHGIMMKKGEYLINNYTGYINSQSVRIGVVFQDFSGERSSISDTGWQAAPYKFVAPSDGVAKVTLSLGGNESFDDATLATMRAAVVGNVKYYNKIFDEYGRYKYGDIPDEIERNKNGYTVFDYSRFDGAGLSGGNVINAHMYRVATPEIMQFDFPIELKADSGYRFGIHAFNDDNTFYKDSGWQTSLFVPAGLKFKTVIAKDAETENSTDCYTGIEWVLSDHVKFRTVVGRNALAQSHEMTTEEKTALFEYGYTYYSNNGTTVFKSVGATASSTPKKLHLPKGTILSVDYGYKFKFYGFEPGSDVFTVGGNDWSYTHLNSSMPYGGVILPKTAEYLLCVDDNDASGLPVADIVQHLHIIIPNSAEWVREIESRTSAIENELSETYTYTNNTPALNTKRQKYNVEQMSVESTPVSSITDVSSNQGMTICNGVIFQLYSNDKIELIDLETGSSIGVLDITSDHGDTIDFSNEYYAEGDEFPLAYITADTTPAKVYVNRITRTGTTLVKTYTFPADKTGYYAGHTLDPVNKILYQIGYTENSYYQDPNGTNYLIVSVWDLKTVTDNGNNVYTPAFVRSFKLPFYTTLQGQAFFDGQIVAVSSHWSNAETKVLFIDPGKEAITTVLDDFPTAIKNAECEGIAFVPDGNKYYSVIKPNNTHYYRIDFS